MPACVPVKELKETAKFAELVRSEDEVVVTKNGYEEFYCLSKERYAALKEQLERAKLMARLELAAKETAAGEVVDFDDFMESLA